MPVTLLDEYGNPVDAPDEAVPALLERGYTVETPEAAQARAEVAQYGTLTEAAKHVAERGVSGLTMGLSDVAAAELGGDEYREARAARERQHAGLGMAAEALGALAPIVASAGTGAAATGVKVAGSLPRATAALGRVAETGVGAALGRLGVTGESIAGRAFLRGTQLATGGTVEGALYGAGHALSEAALAPGGDYDHLAERVWAGAKGGALFGALTGGGLGAIGGGLGAVGKRLMRNTKAGDIAAESAVQALDPSKKASRELVNSKRLQEVGQELLDQDIVKALRSDEDMLARASAVRAQKGDEIGALLKMADETGARPDADALFQRIDGVIGARGGVMSGRHRAVADQIAAEVAPLREAASAGSLTFEQLHRTRRAIDESINWAKAERSPAQADLVEIRRIIEDELEQNAERALAGGGRAAGGGSVKDRLIRGEVPDAQWQYSREGMRPESEAFAAKAYAGAKSADDVATKQEPIQLIIGDDGRVILQDGRHRLAAARKAGAKKIAATVQMRADYDNLGPWDAERVVIAMPGAKVAKAKPAAAAPAASGGFVNQYRAAKRAYGAARWAEKQLNDNLARGQTNRVFGLSENIWGSGGLMAGALTGSLGIGALTGLAATLGHKVVRTYGHGVVATLLSDVVRAEKRMNGTIRRFFKTAGDARRGALGEASAELGERDNKTSRALGQKANETKLQAYQRRMQDLARYQADPAAYLQGKLGKAAAHMPETAMALAGMITRGNAFLQREAPGVPDERVIFGPSRKPNPDPVNMARFARKAQIVDDPMSVLDELEQRSLTTDHIKALEEVYPRLFLDIKSRVADEMAEASERGERLPFSDQVLVGTLLKIPTVPSLLPEHIAMTQAALTMPKAPPRAAVKPGGGASQNHMTKLDRIEAGGLDQ